MPSIRGRIIRILDTRTIVINLGSNAGITGNSVFSILSEPEPVVDPETKEELGRVTVVKAKVKASQVYEKFTIATSRWTETSFPIYSSLPSLLASGFKTEEIDEGELRVDSKDVQPWKARSEIPVRLGDIVEVKVADKPSTSENGAGTEETHGEGGGTEEPDEKTGAE